jgi:membrane associated rhomboid family serine protease
VFPLKDNIPTERFPVVTVALIVVNALMYFVFQSGGILDGPDECNIGEFGAIPREIADPDFHLGACEGNDEPATWVTVFTSMFMHGSLLHIGGNMLFLWIFGNNVEDSMGRVKFLIFYLGGGIAAIAAQTLVDTGAEIPTVGASGAVAAVLGGYILLFPKARVVTIIFIVFFFTIIEIPALIVLGLWIVQQIVFGSLDYLQPTGDGGGVAYFAHIGGFVFGLLMIKLFATRDRAEKPLF